MKRCTFSRISLITFIGAALVASACTNNMSNFSAGSIYGTNSSNSVVTDGGSGTGFITISQVIEDTSTAGTFDIIGDGTNSMGTACVTSSATNPTATPSTTASALPTSTDIQGEGASTCECQLSYTDPSSGANESVLVDTTYHDANMLQCPYSSVPSGATSVTVTVISTTGGGSSNSITINMSTITNGVNPTDPNSFYQVQRYQCRDSVSIMSLFNSLDTTNSIYDPVQSEDPTISYPLNFYTTNFGGAYALYASSNIQNWDCPALPNDPSMPGLDLRVFSNVADSAGSINIYPPTGSAFDRSTFYVAKQATGVFTQALDTYVAPTLYGNGGGANPVGYGAAPAATGVKGEETCPDSSVPIPPGFQWAKLWLFRTGLNQRHYLVSQPISSVTVSCNPGFYSGTTSGPDVFPTCDTNSGSYSTNTSFNGPSNTAASGGNTYVNGKTTFEFGDTRLADRVLGGETVTIGGSAYDACIQMSSISCSANGSTQAPGCTTAASGTSQSAGYPYSSYGLGTDVWNFWIGGPISPVGGTYTNVSDPLELFSDAYKIPKDTAPQDTGTITSDTVNGRSDFLFVVTPPSVMSGDMSTGAADIQQYVPYRFPSYENCPYADPQECTGALQYAYQGQDIAVSGNTTGTTIVFPMCVLQPVTQ